MVELEYMEYLNSLLMLLFVLSSVSTSSYSCCQLRSLRIYKLAKPLQQSFHTNCTSLKRTHEENAPQGAETKDLEEWARKLEHMLAVTPQRMRMIVEGFIDVLELGLEKEGQMVVSS